jgi:hypothetical protein
MALLGSSLSATSASAAVTWDAAQGGGNINWSNIATGTPTAVRALRRSRFDNTATVGTAGTADNIVDSSFIDQFAEIRELGATNFHTTQINNGFTLSATALTTKPSRRQSANTSACRRRCE